jgi:Tfp pilus tip-associated adhesin PilY1
MNKVKWSYQDVDDEDGDSDTTEILTTAKWVVFVATGHARIVSGHGGVNVFAFDLLTGDRLWYFSENYADAVNDTPGAVTTFDIDDDGLVDRVFVGDMNGRMWELNAVDGTNPNGTETVGGVEKQIPLWNAGVGSPISVSPAITRINPVILVFGTGGTDWAANDQAYKIIMVNASDKQSSPTYTGGAGTLLWEKTLAVGEKVWSAPTIAAGQVYVATAFGSMESGDPRDDVPNEGDSTGNLYSLDLKTGSESWSLTDVGKTRGSIYVDRQHVYLTTIDNQLKQIGDGDFSNGQANNVTVRDWRDF